MLKKRLIPTQLAYRKAPKETGKAPMKPVGKWRLLFVVRFLAATVWYSLLARLRPPAGPGGKYTNEFIAQRTRETMERLGGLWIKTGQIIAMRRDIFPKAFCDELSKLHDSATGFPGEVACAIIEAELGCPLREVFSEFDTQPLAAASIGQVHVGRIRANGVRVAVKVQRPSIVESFQSDLKILRFYLTLLKIFRIMPWGKWEEMYWKLSQTLSDELDYRLEVASIRRMRKTLRHQRVYVPKAFVQYCSARVLVMEFIDGVLMSDYLNALNAEPEKAKAWCKENNVDPKKVGKRLFLGFLQQLLEDNLMHGDLHPGNIMLLKNSRYSLIDFGSVDSLDRGFLEKYTLGLTVLAKRDFSKYMDVFLTMVPGLPHVDLETMRMEVVRELQAWESLTDVKGIPYEQRALTGANVRLSAVLGKYHLPPLWNMLRVMRSGMALDASLKFLIPEVNFFKLARRHFEGRRERMLKYMASKSSRQDLVGSLHDLMRLPASLGENLLFQAELIRKRAITFQGQISKAAEVGKALLTTLFNLGLIVTILAVARYINKQHDVGSEAIASLPLRDIFTTMPQLSRGMWILVILLCIYLLRNLRRLVRVLGFRSVGSNPWV
ncbi:ABC1 kinase family protein [Chondromyces apiculatus]|uniref:Ubiquinone biosynthesis monooxygenase UbiB n=1 Tax=Chondromyces apiculatus DSM 436 TaxID=1192034 RepID=A0A017SUB3_9BACT|nr:AarF/UbiB family protein [Chondromyces apiculatus]EYF00543.1 Ubiquinone biosynthesis monooxygenase UbiB [Chondromyces apiculatus DSM 436]